MVVCAVALMMIFEWIICGCARRGRHHRITCNSLVPEISAGLCGGLYGLALVLLVAIDLVDIVAAAIEQGIGIVVAIRTVGDLPAVTSRRQLLQQRLRLLQIARVEALREPPVNRSQQFARLLHLALVAPEAREAHGGAEFPGFGLLLAGDRERALEIRFRFRRIRLAATSARFPRQCDGPRPRTTFPWLFRSPSSLRQCSAKRHRIGRVPHRLSPNMTSTTASTMLLPLTAMRRSRR